MGEMLLHEKSKFSFVVRRANAVLSMKSEKQEEARYSIKLFE
jgi:hypothetical protein